MSRIFNFGSVNIDHVYQVPHAVRLGETLASTHYTQGAGGKGFNQSFALARAGTTVSHIGCIGEDGVWLRTLLEKEGVDCSHLSIVNAPTGHAVIQVLPHGENLIILHGGANEAVTIDLLSNALSTAKVGDWFLCQNETSCVAEALHFAKSVGLKTAYNAAPADGNKSTPALAYVDILIVNETEAMALGKSDSPFTSLKRIRDSYPQMEVILTLGAEGAIWEGASGTIRALSPVCKVVDTTAAGDTFAGYLFAALIDGMSPEQSLTHACHAAALSVTRSGASQSIPRKGELLL